MSVLLTDVTIRFGAQVAVDHASAELPRGIVGLLGRNGAGKTSILRALLGLVRPVAGELRILDLSPDAAPTEVRRHVGYMPEKECQIPGLNGYETVVLAARLTGLPQTEAARRAHEVLYLVGLDEQRYRPVSGYSAGMRQKVKLATALVHDPRILFLDEPTNGLDPAGRSEMLDLIRSLAQDLGKSVVLSSHILQDVERVCSHIVLLERGRVQATGSVEELTRRVGRVVILECAGAEHEIRAGLSAAGVLAVDVEAAERYRLSLPESLPVHAVFAAVRAAGGVVRRLAQHRSTLDEVFRDMVAHAAEGAP